MDLSGADFSGAILDGVDFRRSNLQSARFQEATLLNCDFSSADLVNGNLKNIDADGCTFREADLRASSWRNSRLSNSTFRNAKHTGVDMRDVKFEDVRWTSDRYRGGLRLDGASIEGLIGITESHGVLKQIVINQADGRQQFHGLAGAIDLGFAGCWQYSLQYIENLFSREDRDEILEAMKASRKWLNHLRLDYEYMRRDWLCKELGGEPSEWSLGKIKEVMKQAKDSGKIFSLQRHRGSAQRAGDVCSKQHQRDRLRFERLPRR